MRIELITPEQHSRLLEIQKSNPKLTFQNNGYEYIKDLSEDDKEKVNEIETMLKKHVKGFSSFSNFRLDKNGELQVRLQYNYGTEDNTTQFIGVGYLLLDELLEGFRV